MAGLQFTAQAAERLERAYSFADIRAQREETLRRLALKPGEAAIDIGCGPGYLCESMAELVGPGGSVLGIDASGDLVARAAERNARPWLAYRPGDAAVLDVPDESFDVAVCTQVLEYVPDVDRALGEMFRVLRAGGRALIVDTDWDSVVWHSAESARMNAVLHAFDAHCADAHLPRTLPARLAAAGFRVENVSGWSIVNLGLHEEAYSRGLLRLIEDFVGRRGSVPGDDLTAWVAEQRALDRTGEYFFAVTRMFFCARKPGADA